MSIVTQDEKLKRAVAALKREFNPMRLFLFGSRASGQATEDSDYDFVVVVKDTGIGRLDNMAKARKLLHAEADISADVFVYPELEFEEWKDEFSSIPETAMNTGVEISLNE